MPTRLPRSILSLAPMLATTAPEVPRGDGWEFEPKYDGIRLLAFVTDESVRLMTRNGNDRCNQFPEVVQALLSLARRVGRPLVLDGEVVAMDGDTPLRFQALQQMRMRLPKRPRPLAVTPDGATPTTLFVFDFLADGDELLIGEPWTSRRARLERLLARRTTQHLRITEPLPDSGDRAVARARKAGWEGVMAKRTDARYERGKRSDAWLKLKVEQRQEFVIGGYTEPRKSREHIGALLLGYYEGDRFIYAGHTGGGFTREGLAEMAKRLRPLERKTSPFEVTPKTNERAHWVRPKVVVEVRFNEWTDDGRLRQPIFLGVRTDKNAEDVTREPSSVQRASRKRVRRG